MNYSYRRQRLVLLCSCLLNVNLLPHFISPIRDVPFGFDIVLISQGVTLYHNELDYVQVVDLSQGASIQFLQGDITEPGYGKGVYGGNDPALQRQTLEEIWLNFSTLNSRAFSVINGQFFRDDKNSDTNLAFPVKVEGQFTSDGYAGEIEFPEEKLILEIWNNRADITKFRGKLSFLLSSAPSSIVGLKENADKVMDKQVGRTFLGIKDADENGTYETLLIFSSPAATQAHASETLKSFGAAKVIMLDGGGSTKLVVQDVAYINSARTIPQAIGVLSAPSSQQFR